MPRQNFVSSLVNTIKGPARLAKKYQMDVILDHLLSLLKDAWPTRLEDWDRRESVVRAQITSDEDWRPDTPYAVDMIPDPGITHMPSCLVCVLMSKIQRTASA